MPGGQRRSGSHAPRNTFTGLREESAALAFFNDLRRQIDAALQHKVNRGEEQIRVERLRDKSGGTKRQRVHYAFTVCDTREHENLK